MVILLIFYAICYTFLYTFLCNSIDVHGASGLDHFVHRFTHRVARGVLIAVGRPDGRLCCLAKSEAAVLLAAKQAAFIRNPEYPGASSGPEFVTVGHNPFKPNLGLANHAVISNTVMKVHTDGNGKVLSKVVQDQTRRKFMDEYLYERLFLAQKPFTKAILRSLVKSRLFARSMGNIRQLSCFTNVETPVDDRRKSMLLFSPSSSCHDYHSPHGLSETSSLNTTRHINLKPTTYSKFADKHNNPSFDQFSNHSGVLKELSVHFSSDHDSKSDEIMVVNRTNSGHWVDDLIVNSIKLREQQSSMMSESLVSSVHKRRMADDRFEIDDNSRRNTLHSFGSMHGYVSSHSKSSQHQHSHHLEQPQEQQQPLKRDVLSNTDESEPIPYGAHHIEYLLPNLGEDNGGATHHEHSIDMFAEFFLNCKDLLSAKSKNLLKECIEKKI